MPLLQLTADDVRNREKFGRSGLVFEHWPLLELLITTHRSEEPVFIEEIAVPKHIIQNFRQAMVVMVISLLKVCQFVEKPWLS